MGRAWDEREIQICMHHRYLNLLGMISSLKKVKQLNSV